MPAMDPVACLCTNARRAALALTSIYDEALAPHGLKVTQFSLLRAVERHGAPNLTGLSEATGLDRSTLGRNLRVLEAAGVVLLSAGDDQRDRVVTLTPKGRARVRAAASRGSGSRALRPRSARTRTARRGGASRDRAGGSGRVPEVSP